MGPREAKEAKEKEVRAFVDIKLFIHFCSLFRSFFFFKYCVVILIVCK